MSGRWRRRWPSAARAGLSSCCRQSPACRCVATRGFHARMRRSWPACGPCDGVRPKGAGQCGRIGAVENGANDFRRQGELSHMPVGRAGSIEEAVAAVLFFCDPLNTLYDRPDAQRRRWLDRGLRTQFLTRWSAALRHERFILAAPGPSREWKPPLRPLWCENTCRGVD